MVAKGLFDTSITLEMVYQKVNNVRLSLQRIYDDHRSNLSN